jgi:hypothetical protein
MSDFLDALGWFGWLLVTLLAIYVLSHLDQLASLLNRVIGI